MQSKKYKNQKDKLRGHINKFSMTDDMFHLAEAYKLIRQIVEEQGFPLVEFQEYTKRVKKNTDEK